MEKLKIIIYHPITNILTAMVLIATSLAEGWDAFSMDLSEFDAGVHHGVLLFGIMMFIRGVIEALESIVKAHERTNK